MKRYIIIFIILLVTCGCSGGGSGGTGSGGSDESDIPGGSDEKIIAVIGEGTVDYYIFNIQGAREIINPPLRYYISDLQEGEYFCQVQAVYHAQKDWPINFYLLIIEYSEDDITYEILPETFEDNFDKENLIYP